jgi:hypothetical protein
MTGLCIPSSFGARGLLVSLFYLKSADIANQTHGCPYIDVAITRPHLATEPTSIIGSSTRFFRVSVMHANNLPAKTINYRVPVLPLIHHSRSQANKWKQGHLQ